MKCDTCGEEIALAKTCPYCGSVLKQKKEPAEQFSTSEPVRGRWFGPINRGAYRSGRNVIGLLPALFSYFRDPAIAWWKKGVIVGGLAYVISPLDMIPEIFPVLGFLDDVAVAALTWRLLVGELKKYTGKRL